MNNNAITFSELLLKLQQFWADQGCNIVQPYDIPSGAGTFHPATLLKSLDSKPWSA
ncbi:MAG TPA: glycine--tRNA ligase subunit alpha, partial [Sulfurovum sp.]|nr:glycine--tRNA ligase subunit alpha [Sulfurovum sp.]